MLCLTAGTHNLLFQQNSLKALHSAAANHLAAVAPHVGAEQRIWDRDVHFWLGTDLVWEHARVAVRCKTAETATKACTLIEKAF